MIIIETMRPESPELTPSHVWAEEDNDRLRERTYELVAQQYPDRPINDRFRQVTDTLVHTAAGYTRSELTGIMQHVPRNGLAMAMEYQEFYRVIEDMAKEVATERVFGNLAESYYRHCVAPQTADTAAYEQDYAKYKPLLARLGYSDVTISLGEEVPTQREASEPVTPLEISTRTDEGEVAVFHASREKRSDMRHHAGNVITIAKETWEQRNPKRAGAMGAAALIAISTAGTVAQQFKHDGQAGKRPAISAERAPHQATTKLAGGRTARPEAPKTIDAASMTPVALIVDHATKVIDTAVARNKLKPAEAKVIHAHLKQIEQVGTDAKAAAAVIKTSPETPALKEKMPALSEKLFGTEKLNEQQKAQALLVGSLVTNVIMQKAVQAVPDIAPAAPNSPAPTTPEVPSDQLPPQTEQPAPTPSDPNTATPPETTPAPAAPSTPSAPNVQPSAPSETDKTEQTANALGVDALATPPILDPSNINPDAVPTPFKEIAQYLQNAQVLVNAPVSGDKQPLSDQAKQSIVDNTQTIADAVNSFSNVDGAPTSKTLSELGKEFFGTDTPLTAQQQQTILDAMNNIGTALGTPLVDPNEKPDVPATPAQPGTPAPQTPDAPQHGHKGDNPHHPERGPQESAEVSHLVDVGVPEVYAKMYVKYGQQYGIPAELLAAQGKQESGYDPNITSPVGAVGIAQFMPDTWAEWRDRLGFPKDASPTDPDLAIHAQAAYMHSLIKFVQDNGIDGNVYEDALAAYNSGMGHVLDANGIPNFPETKGYVKNIMALYNEWHQQSGESENQNLPPQTETGRAAYYAQKLGIPESAIDVHSSLQGYLHTYIDINNQAVLDQLGIKPYGGYPDKWLNPPKDALIDDWDLYSRECVSYAAFRVTQNGFNLPSFNGHGNAYEWDEIAKQLGVNVDDSPAKGAIIQWNRNGPEHHSFGHVAYIEGVLDDGSVLISEFNNGGTGQFSVEVLSPQYLAKFKGQINILHFEQN